MQSVLMYRNAVTEMSPDRHGQTEKSCLNTCQVENSSKISFMVIRLITIPLT